MLLVSKGLKRYIISFLFFLILFVLGLFYLFSVSLVYNLWLILLLVIILILFYLFWLYLFLFKLFNGEKNLSIYISDNFLVKRSKVVVIGGGSGISNILEGLKEEFDYLVSVSTVTDDGGSTGKILKIYEDVLPVGDLRNCLASLSNDEVLKKLLQYRFDRGEFQGHALGNLMLLALYKIANNNLNLMAQYINTIFRIRGVVLASAKKRGILVAKLSNQMIIKGESNINNFIVCNPEVFIEKIYLEDLVDEDVNEEVVKNILDADIIIIGPGSFYTSIVPNFLLKPILDAYNNSKAIKIYVANIMNQPNEIKEQKLSKYIEILHNYGIYFDYLLVNNKPVMQELLNKYLEKDRFYKLIENDVEPSKYNIKIIEGDFIKDDSFLIRHDPLKVSKAIKKIYINKL